MFTFVIRHMYIDISPSTLIFENLGGGGTPIPIHLRRIGLCLGINHNVFLTKILANASLNIYKEFWILLPQTGVRILQPYCKDVLSVYCFHVILFDIFFITLLFVYLQKLLNCLIIYLYKTNPSFSPCPWNLRSIGPSDFNKVIVYTLI